MSARAQSVRKPIDRTKHLSVVDRRRKASGKKKHGRTKAFVITVSLLLGGAIVMGVLLEQVTLAQSAFELAELAQEASTLTLRTPAPNYGEDRGEDSDEPEGALDWYERGYFLEEDSPEEAMAAFRTVGTKLGII